MTASVERLRKEASWNRRVAALAAREAMRRLAVDRDLRKLAAVAAGDNVEEGARVVYSGRSGHTYYTFEEGRKFPKVKHDTAPAALSAVLARQNLPLLI